MSETVHEALEREHHEIDAAIESVLANLDDPVGSEPGLREAMVQLRRHIYVEEAFLFPPINHGASAMPVLVMLREHGAIWRAMDELDAALDAGPDVDAVTAVCDRLNTLLAEHNSKEEPIIYPMAQEALTDADAQMILKVLDSGHMPEGWTCEQAQL